MPLPRMSTLCWLPLLVIISACDDGGLPTGTTPLLDSSPVAVTLTTTTISTEGLPRLYFTGLSGAVEVLWDVESHACLLAEASAERAGKIVVIHITRSGNPGALCTSELAGYRYVARVAGLASGRYQVRLVDELANQPAREVGRDSVTVLPGASLTH